MFDKNNGQKLLKFDERYEFMHSRISMNTEQVKLKEIHGHTMYKDIICDNNNKRADILYVIEAKLVSIQSRVL